MTADKRTPGEWVVHSDEYSVAVGEVWADGTSWAFADLFVGQFIIGSHARALKKAHLIAAAPDLLAALQEVIGIVQASIVSAKGRGEFPLIVADLERREANARAAIAKATGEGA